MEGDVAGRAKGHVAGGTHHRGALDAHSLAGVAPTGDHLIFIVASHDGHGNVLKILGIALGPWHQVQGLEVVWVQDAILGGCAERFLRREQRDC